MYTTKEILNDLDTNAVYEFFLDLEHGYFFTAGSRINLFADDDRWAIVFEKSGYGNRSGRAEIELNYFGNCLIKQPGAGLNNQFISNTNYVTLIDGNEFEKVEDGFERVSKQANSIKVRDTNILIEQDVSAYKMRGIEFETYENPDYQIDFPSLVRFLDETNPELFRATEAELFTFLPGDLPEIMKIDKWYHTPIKEYGGPNPSENETFQLIAEILETKDINRWEPKLKPNNNWRNWPEAGGL